MWDRKVEGGFPELKFLVENSLLYSLESNPAHDRVWTETTNQGQGSARKGLGSLGCRASTLVDRHGVYVIVIVDGSCLSFTC